MIIAPIQFQAIVSRFFDADIVFYNLLALVALAVTWVPRFTFPAMCVAAMLVQ